jgi:hypothetical protein
MAGIAGDEARFRQARIEVQLFAKFYDCRVQILRRGFSNRLDGLFSERGLMRRQSACSQRHSEYEAFQDRFPKIVYVDGLRRSPSDAARISMQDEPRRF